MADRYCKVCGVVKVNKGYLYCSDCERKKRNESARIYRKNKKAKLEAAGLCIKCGKHAPAQGKKSCSDCLMKHRINSKLRYRKKTGAFVSNQFENEYRKAKIKEAERLRELQITTKMLQPVDWCPFERDCNEVHNTLCWTCGNSLEGCLIDRNNIPPEGAKTEIVTLFYNGKKGTYHHVKYCPNYECDCEIMR